MITFELIKALMILIIVKIYRFYSQLFIYGATIKLEQQADLPHGLTLADLSRHWSSAEQMLRKFFLFVKILLKVT